VEGKYNFSDPEKTLLDMIYLSRYNGLSESEIIGRVSDILKHCNDDKLASYAEKYPKSVKKFLGKIK